MTISKTTGEAPQHTGNGSKRRLAWSMTAVVVGLYTINYADKAAFGIIAQPLERELGLTASQIGMVGSLFFFAFTIAGFGSGLLNRWLGLRLALLALPIIWSVSVLPVVISASFVTLVVGRIVLGLAEGPSSALMHTAVYSWHPPEKRGLPSAILLSATSLAKIIFAPLLAVITASWGWRSAMIFLAVLGAAWCVAWLFSWRDGPYIASAKKPQRNRAVEAKISYAKILTSRTFIFGALLFMGYYGLQTVILTWLPSYYEVGLGYSSVAAGSLFALPSVVALIFMLGFSRLTDVLIGRGWTNRRTRVLFAGSGVLICAIMLIFVPYIETPALVVAIISIAYGIGSTAAPLLTSVVSVVTPSRQLAGTLGVYMSIMAVGGLIAPSLAGFIVDAASSPAVGFSTAFQVVGAAAGVFALLALVFMNPERDRQRLVKIEPKAQEDDQPAESS